MCEAIGEARRHRPCLRGTAFGACSSALMAFLRFTLGVRRAESAPRSAAQEFHQEL